MRDLILAIGLGCCVAGVGWGQVLRVDGVGPGFAVASVRPMPADGDQFQRTTERADGLTVNAMTLREMVAFAYGLPFEDELTGGPAWMGRDRFLIEAKVDEGKAAALSKVSRDDLDEQMRLMLQTLLAERFGLKVRVVKREMPVYALVVAKAGLKCPKVEADSPFTKTRPRFAWSSMPPPPPPPPGWHPPTPEEAHARATTQAMHMGARFWPFWLWVTAISHEPDVGGRVVVDRTGLEGSYDCELTWSRAGSEGPGPSLFTALQEQMGLKLEPSKGMVETVAVEAAERPSEN